jgi:hypothetical protein
MSDYFRKFPIISYNGVRVRDITRRVAFSQKKLRDPLLFLPYTIRENEKAEDLAHNYYGSVDYTWLVLMANDMLDPYTDWPLNTEMLNRYFIDTYAEISGAADYDVIAWGQSEMIADNIIFYYKSNEQNKVIRVGPETFTLEAALQAGWSAMRIYDYEFALNEEKRNIQLIDKLYKDKIDNEFRKLIVK